MEKKWFDPIKGWGVIALEEITKGTFLLEYRGTHALLNEMQEKIKLYTKKRLSYVYEYNVGSVKHCIDATDDDGSLGRLVNDSYLFPNAKMKKIQLSDSHHLCLFAVQDISVGEEVLYFYGEKDLPWHEDEKKDRKIREKERSRKLTMELLKPTITR